MVKCCAPRCGQLTKIWLEIVIFCSTSLLGLLLYQQIMYLYVTVFKWFCFLARCHTTVFFVAGQSLFIFVPINLVGGPKKSVYYQVEFAAQRLQKCARLDQVQK